MRLQGNLRDGAEYTHDRGAVTQNSFDQRPSRRIIAKNRKKRPSRKGVFWGQRGLPNGEQTWTWKTRRFLFFILEPKASSINCMGTVKIRVLKFWNCSGISILLTLLISMRTFVPRIQRYDTSVRSWNYTSKAGFLSFASNLTDNISSAELPLWKKLRYSCPKTKKIVQTYEYWKPAKVGSSSSEATICVAGTPFLGASIICLDRNSSIGIDLPDRFYD